MASEASLVARLKTVAQIQESEGISDDILATFVSDAIVTHNPAYTYASLPLREEELVLTLAAISLCVMRANGWVNGNDLKGSTSGASGGYGQERGTPFYKNMKLAEFLQTRYESLVNNLAKGDESGSGTIVMGYLNTKNRVTGALVGESVSPILPVSLVLNAVGETEAIINWNFARSQNFAQLFVFMSDEPGIKQDWNAEGVGTVPFINTLATLVISFYDQNQKSLKVVDLVPDTKHYFMVATMTRSNRYAYSNELIVRTLDLAPHFSNPLTPDDLTETLTAITGQVTVDLSYQFTASNSPTAFAVVSGLPAGLSLATDTGLLTGAPTTAGTYVLRVSATNAEGTNEATLQIVVAV
jgi:hypothetical protein